MSGGIHWIGLVVPHFARMLVGADHVKLLPTSAFMGGIYLLALDDIARAATAQEIPIGLLTALLGAPIFAVLLWRFHARGVGERVIRGAAQDGVTAVGRLTRARGFPVEVSLCSIGYSAPIVKHLGDWALRGYVATPSRGDIAHAGPLTALFSSTGSIYTCPVRAGRGRCVDRRHDGNRAKRRSRYRETVSSRKTSQQPQTAPFTWAASAREASTG